MSKDTAYELQVEDVVVLMEKTKGHIRGRRDCEIALITSNGDMEKAIQFVSELKSLRYPPE